MKIIIEGAPKEIAALVLELQERSDAELEAEDISKEISQRLQKLISKDRQAFSP